MQKKLSRFLNVYVYCLDYSLRYICFQDYYVICVEVNDCAEVVFWTWDKETPKWRLHSV